LEDDDVGIWHSQLSHKPTCTATVTVGPDGSATYVFSIDGTATFDFGDWLPDPYRYKPSLLYIGTLATIVQPGAEVLLNWARQVSELAPIIFDPNIRPAVLADRVQYLRKVEEWIEISSVVKVSLEDLLWLCPNDDPYEVAMKWIGDSSLLVILTKGAEGISAMSSEGRIDVPAVKIEVIDTVGAGDTVGAIIAQAVSANSPFNLRGAVLSDLLRCASVAAAITCSRTGANPPTKRELMAALETQA
jgi:fructokinase